MLTHSEANPWITHHREVRYNNPWIKVEHHEVTTPGGSEGIYGMVKFKNLALGIIPIDDKGYTWIVGQYRYPLDIYSWEIPMGGGPHGIDPLLSAQRELQEEVGITAGSWDCIMKIHTSNSVTNETGYIYVATDLTLGATAHEDTEQIAIRHLPFDEVYDMVMAGTITDAITIAGILKCKVILGR